MYMKKFLILAILLVGFCFSASATHNRAGEITYRHIGGLQYEVKITTYTKESSQAADRDKLTIKWGDGKEADLPRVNGQGQSLGNDVQKNVYLGTHTYNGPGSYILSMEDPNRVDKIVNITGSINVPFYIQTNLIINPFGGEHNNSPVLNFPPIDDACLNKLFIHNPGATDADGDSLSYALIDVKGSLGEKAPQYYIPANVTINAVTGDLIWNTPKLQGEYNFAIEITEWRLRGNKREKIGYVVRDLQVTVGFCQNEPPVIAPLRDTCVEAGTFIQLPISATDPDNNQVTLSGQGLPFTLARDSAFFSPLGLTGTGSISTNFTWDTKCSHVKKSAYPVYIRAVDDGNPLFNARPVLLSDYKSFNITVVGPSPKNPTAGPQGNDIALSWDISACPEVVGYQIYRRAGSYGFVPSSCETGVPAYTGFTLVGSVTGINTTNYLDQELIHGTKYCYMIVAIYPDGAQSYASVEVCAELKKDVPIITNVSVLETGATGEVYVAWFAPTELDDTIQFTGPTYYYRIYRAAGLNGTDFQLIDSTGASVNYQDSITYMDRSVNTTADANAYRIELVSGQTRVGNSHVASSVFLTITADPKGKALNLSWQENVPWTNYRYDIFRFDSQTSQFDSIGTTTISSYQDTGLVNLEEYCYYIRSVGAYSIDGVVNPIINLSQRTCGIPNDIEPPCVPIMQIRPDCNLEINTITWRLPEENDECSNDAVKYSIYYTPVLGGDYLKASDIQGNHLREYVHQRPNSIAGCYYITSTDEYGNESTRVDTLCVDNCPLYELPNVFSPDGDGNNDLFRPFPYKFVESIDLQIFNRWGQIVFHSNDPDINWNGVNITSNRISMEGVYFYVCTVNEIRLTGIVPRTLQGSLHLFRNSNTIPQIPD
jgi:gliding motility-associated-like protein